MNRLGSYNDIVYQCVKLADCIIFCFNTKVNRLDRTSWLNLSINLVLRMYFFQTPSSNRTVVAIGGACVCFSLGNANAKSCNSTVFYISSSIVLLNDGQVVIIHFRCNFYCRAIYSFSCSCCCSKAGLRDQPLIFSKLQTQTLKI